MINSQIEKNEQLQEEMSNLAKENEELRAKKGQLTEEMVGKFINDIKILKEEKDQLQKELDQVAADKMKAMNSVMAQL